MEMTRENKVIFNAALNLARQQLDDAQKEFIRVTHNSNAVIYNIEKEIDALQEESGEQIQQGGADHD